MCSSLRLARVTVILLLASVTLVCAKESLQDRVNKDPLALLTHMHLASVEDHRIPAFVITQVSHSEYKHPSDLSNSSSSVSRPSSGSLESTNFPSPPVDPESIERSQSDEITVPVVLATTTEHVRKPARRHHTTVMRTSESIHHTPKNYEDLIARPYDAASAQEETSPESHLRSSVRSYQPITYVNEEIGEPVEPKDVMHISMAKHTASIEETPAPAPSTEAPTTTAAPETTTPEAVETTEAPREIIHSNPSYISESSQSLGEDAKIPLLIPVRKRAPVTTRYTLVSSDGHGRPSYVSSDVYTIETTTKYRPRTMHSNSIFYQKALAYLKAYKKELVQRRPLGPTYRLNANSDDPSHVVTAYGEIPPVVAESYASKSEPTGHSSPGRANLYQQQEMEPANGPSSDESLAVTDREREVIGYLPVVRLPRPMGAPVYATKEQRQENIPYASASASASSSSPLSPSSSPIDESSIMGKKPVSPSASSYLSPSLRLRKKSSARLIGTASNKLVHRTNRINAPSASASSSSFGYSPISSLLEPTFPVLTVSVKRPI